MSRPSKVGFSPQPVKMSSQFALDDNAVVSHSRGMSIRAGVPPDGLERNPRPTELLLAALAGCVLANVAIAAENLGVDASSVRARVENTDAQDPPRIEKIVIAISGLERLSPDDVLSVFSTVRQQSRMYNTIAPSLPVILTADEN